MYHSGVHKHAIPQPLLSFSFHLFFFTNASVCFHPPGRKWLVEGLCFHGPELKHQAAFWAKLVWSSVKQRRACGLQGTSASHFTQTVSLIFSILFCKSLNLSKKKKNPTATEQVITHLRTRLSCSNKEGAPSGSLHEWVSSCVNAAFMQTHLMKMIFNTFVVGLRLSDLRQGTSLKISLDFSSSFILSFWWSTNHICFPSPLQSFVIYLFVIHSNFFSRINESFG